MTPNTVVALRVGLRQHGTMAAAAAHEGEFRA
jgi:hypothetical protein